MKIRTTTCGATPAQAGTRQIERSRMPVAAIPLFLLLLVSPCCAVDAHAVADSILAWRPRMESQVGQVRITREVQADRKTFQTISKSGANARLEVRHEEHGKLIAVTIIDGAGGTAVLPIIGRRSVPSKEIILQQLRWSPWSLIADSVRVTGSDTANGLDCWTLELDKLVGYSTATIWLDKQWLIEQKGECETADGNKYRWVHSDFRPVVEHFSFPYQTMTYADGKLVSTAIVRSIELNVNLDDSLFDRQRIGLKE